jgi:hypothetical protein
VFWVAVFMSLFTALITVIFYFFTRIANRIFTSINDPATGEKLTEKNKKFEIRKVLQLPWIFWCILAFALLETSTAVVFTQKTPPSWQSRDLEPTPLLLGGILRPSNTLVCCVLLPVAHC